jgi:hypothetical protein
LIQLVQPESARERLTTAQSKVSSGDTLTALDDVAIALAEVLRDYDETHRGEWGRSLYYLGTYRAPPISVHLRQSDNEHEALLKAIKDQRNDLDESLDVLRRAINIIGLGLDYAKYARFQQRTPHVSQGVTGKYFIDRRHDEKNPPATEVVKQCIDYVIEAAVQIQHVR